jgi:hypothetical protein
MVAMGTRLVKNAMHSLKMALSRKAGLHLTSAVQKSTSLSRGLISVWSHN